MRSLIAIIDRRIAKAEERMSDIVAADPEMVGTDDRLRTIPGIGPIIGATLIADLPELGQIDRRRIAALISLAPIARDSGTRSGRRTIGGGRPIVRTALYIAALHASRHGPHLAAFRARLQAAGKPAKAAIITTARKRLTILNARIATKSDYRQTASA